MKLIIDISEKDYNEICKDYFLNDDIYTAIKNGIPLEQIRAEIEKELGDNLYKNDGIYCALHIIDKYTKAVEE